VTQDAIQDNDVEDPLLEGGGTPEERQASFLELALCLAAGLPDAALDPLFVVSKDPWICRSRLFPVPTRMGTQLAGA
jgi:hypothetical protein